MSVPTKFMSPNGPVNLITRYRVDDKVSIHAVLLRIFTIYKRLLKAKCAWSGPLSSI